MMDLKISDVFLLFTIYAHIGWLMEMVVNVINQKKIVNRGFLIGPICPIYGCGCIAMIFLLNRYLEDPLVLFMMAILICSVLEYATSYWMEKLFKARWWDYSNKKFNINGRICAETMIPFGLLGCLVMYEVHPLVMKVVTWIPSAIRLVLALVILLVFVSDIILSFAIVSGLKNTIKKVALDNTEEITKRVKEVILSRSFLSKRLIKAFPNLEAIINFKSHRKRNKKKDKEGEDQNDTEFLGTGGSPNA